MLTGGGQEMNFRGNRRGERASVGGGGGGGGGAGRGERTGGRGEK